MAYDTNENTYYNVPKDRIELMRKLINAKRMRKKLDDEIRIMEANCKHIGVNLGGENPSDRCRCLICGKALDSEPVLDASLYKPEYNETPFYKYVNLQNMMTQISEQISVYNNYISNSELVSTMRFLIDEVVKDDENRNKHSI